VGENTGGTPGGKSSAGSAGSAETDLADAKALVARSYDQIALRYAAWRIEGNPAMRFVRELDARLPDGADVLELGCGRGVPVGRELAKRHRLTGVDISAAQIELARHHVPEASFIHADYTELEVAAASLDAVVAILTLTHVPREEHAALLSRIARWLRDGGFFLCSLGTADTPGAVEEDWLGAPMFFSHYDADTNRRLVREAGFEAVLEEIVAMHEEGHGEARFLWLLGQKSE
jgi:cyclopropane fatty-acyl-phospholipid synthase-like methyltransferase